MKAKNQKCACGSGRKARYCCMKEEVQKEASALMQEKIKRTLSTLAGKLQRYFEETYDHELLQVAFDDLTGGQLERLKHSPAINLELFYPFLNSWLHYRWDSLPEDRARYRAPKPGQIIAGTFLAKNRSTLSKLEQDILTAGIHSCVSLYHVEDIDPKNHLLTLKDFFRSTPDEPYILKIKDVEGAKSMQVSAVMLGLVIEVNGYAVLEGLAAYPFPISHLVEAQRVREIISNLTKGNNTSLTMQEHEDRILGLYFDVLLDNLAPKVLTNTDGEAYQSCKVFYDVTDWAAAARALASLAGEAQQDVEEDIAEAEENGFKKSGAIEFPWLTPNIPKGQTGPIVLGHVKISQDRLSAEFNSRERLQRFRETVERLAGALVSFKAESFDSEDPLERATVKHRANSSRSTSQKGSRIRSPSAQTPAPPPEFIAQMIEMGKEKKKAFYDTKIPMLDGKTPREAAKTEKGRELLEALIQVYAAGHLDEDPLNFSQYFNPTEEEIRSELDL